MFLSRNYSAPEIVNVGWGQDVSILELAELVKGVVGYAGDIKLDASKPDRTPRKLLDVSKLTKLGWRPKIPLEPGIESTYAWFLQHIDNYRD